jgi:hypothetical protein
METTLERQSLLGLTNLAGAHTIRALACEYFRATNAGITSTGDVWISKYGDAHWATEEQLAAFHDFAIEHVSGAERSYPRTRVAGRLH